MDTLPDHNYGELPDGARQALQELVGRNDPAIIGIVLTGSAARGMATRRSDVDVLVIRDESETTREVARSAVIDEIPVTLRDLETVKPVSSESAWDRWAYAWALVLRDSTGGRISNAVRRQATLDPQEVQGLLTGGCSRLDEYLNFTYRSLKSHRDARPAAARLDSAESIPALLDMVFALRGRVRPYNKYLTWELREHPLSDDEWHVDKCMARVNGLLMGDETITRETFRIIDLECRAYDLANGSNQLSTIIDDWGEELKVLHGTGS